MLPARVRVSRGSGGSGEVLLLEERADLEAAPRWWEALCRPARRLRRGDVLDATSGSLRFEVGEDLGGGRMLVRPIHDGELHEALAAAGSVPLPPYLDGELEDPERYQTVYARRAASAAAPTAGLHLTPALLAAVEAAGARTAHVELVVGLDTFRPVATESIEDHVIHTEHYDVPARTWEAVEAARAGSGRVVAVGTTTTRALETAAATGRLSGRTSLFVTPGHRWAAVDVLLTNFHLPRSSLLAMVEAFVGPRWRDLYELALGEGYRFLSFGDAMLLGRAPEVPTGEPVAGAARRTERDDRSGASEH